MDLENLFSLAVKHRNAHDCSAYPYENGEKLVEWIQKTEARKILEIGTGMGYTATIMALSNPAVRVDTIEKDSEHAQIARDFLIAQKAREQVTVINELAESYLGTLQNQYDFIFFDGYQIHYEFLPHYERLMKKDGILFAANNHLQSKTSAKFFAELEEQTKWKILEKFADTTIAQKL